MNSHKSLWHIYGVATCTSLVLLAAVAFKASGPDFVAVLILAGLEITFSFDNAVVNARILGRMSPVWQKLFLTVGIVIAVFGVRLLLPLLIVSLTAGIGLSSVVNLALHHSAEYGAKLGEAHALIAAFGGIFLLMIFLDFILGDREIKWLRSVENTLVRIGKLENISVIIALGFTILGATVLSPGHEELRVLLAGLVGLITYLSINTLDAWLTRKKTSNPSADHINLMRAGIASFLYLELIDASFSLDGVIGAFAITDKVLLIVVGLGIGAIYVRSLTVHMLHRGMLQKYRYMEHGAHYAIGILAVLLLLSLRYKIPEIVTGLSGLLVIITAIIHSHIEEKRQA